MVEFFNTMMGKKFYESDVPRLVSALERIATALEKSKVKPTNRDDVPVCRTGSMITIGDYFIVTDDGFVYCETCAKDKGIDIDAPDTVLWEVFGGGWLGPCICAGCDLSIPVYVNGEPEPLRAHLHPKKS